MEQQLKPLFVGKQERKAKVYVGGWNANKDGVQKIMALYSEMGLGAIETNEELHRLFNDTNGLVFDKQTGGGAIIRGVHETHLPVNKDVAMGLFQRPDGFDTLAAQIANFSSKCIANMEAENRFDTKNVTRYFEIVEGQVHFSAMQQAQNDNAGKCYAITEKGQAIYRFLQKVSAAVVDEQLEKYIHFGENGITRRIEEPIMKLFMETRFEGIDGETKQPIIEFTGSVTRPQFWGDRM